MLTQDIFVRRSILILPVNNKKFVEKAWLRGADAIQLDLEDSVLESEKDAAREMVRDAIAIAGKGGSDILVRINNSKDYIKDLYASVYPGLHTIVLPKVEDAHFIEEVASILTELEKERKIPVGSIKIGILIETAKGFMNIKKIVNANNRIITVILGTEDFTADLQIELSDDVNAIFVPKIMTLIAARAAGVYPMGLLGSMTNYKDLEGLYKQARIAYKHGFIGSSCIHPNQVPVLNRAFTPSKDEVEYAYKVIEAYEQAQATGKGATSFDGKMIDLPIVNRAYTIIKKIKAIERIEKRKKEALKKIGEEGSEQQ